MRRAFEMFDTLATVSVRSALTYREKGRTGGDLTMSKDDKEKNFEKLRNKVDSLEEKLEVATQVALERTVEQAGFDPNVGVVKMLLDTYAPDDFDLSEVDPDGFREFAVEQGYEPASNGESEEAEAEAGESKTAQQQVIEGNQEEAEELSRVTTESDEVSDVMAEADEALLDGDVDTSISKKLGML